VNLDAFRKKMTVQKLVKAWLDALGPVVAKMAEMEGLDAHRHVDCHVHVFVGPVTAMVLTVNACQNSKSTKENVEKSRCKCVCQNQT
jgi:hypothetical protein